MTTIAALSGSKQIAYHTWRKNKKFNVLQGKYYYSCHVNPSLLADPNPSVGPVYYTRGIVNPGLTCYMNAVVQLLFNNVQFLYILLNYEDDGKNKLATAFKDLIPVMFSTKLQRAEAVPTIEILRDALNEGANARIADFKLGMELQKQELAKLYSGPSLQKEISALKRNTKKEHDEVLKLSHYPPNTSNSTSEMYMDIMNILSRHPKLEPQLEKAFACTYNTIYEDTVRNIREVHW